jgi:hypothetical protein
MVALGDHLRSEEDRAPLRGEPFEDPGVVPLGGRGVRVEP